ncbi:unnamed protein product [Owenia fusiformis]|uniref:Uncharacterized protein n=1 Tax=Owenia fusiformis TaxID=6347 RepID=A0A8J1T4T2_OWEFU|nr:unnamed protein product [Owenia fusiformis]
MDGNWESSTKLTLESLSDLDQTETSEYDDDAIIRERQFCGGLCCFKGCLIGTLGFVYFLLVIPTGILLTMHGSNNANNITLVIGLCLLIVPTVTATSICGIYQYRRYKTKCIAQEEKYKTGVNGSNSSQQRY